MSNDKKKESNLFEEIKKLDEKKEKLCKSIAEINAFSWFLEFVAISASNFSTQFGLNRFIASKT